MFLLGYYIDFLCLCVGGSSGLNGGFLEDLFIWKEFLLGKVGFKFSDECF